MLIHEMTEKECSEVLEQARLGRLACAHDNQPYIVPIYFAYHGDHLYGLHLGGKYLYGFTTLGQKIEWMRLNPLVCVETDEVTNSNQWMSIIIFGRYQELPDTPDFEAARVMAHDLLQRHPMWWQPGFVSTVHRDPSQPLTPIYYRIDIERVTGHRAIPEEADATLEGHPSVKKHSWLRDLLYPEKIER